MEREGKEWRKKLREIKRKPVLRPENFCRNRGRCSRRREKKNKQNVSI